MDRTQLGKWWDEAWQKGLWAAPWQKALADLSAAEAAWKPAPGRMSIWQMVHHMLFWREDAIRRLTDPTPPSESAVAQGNFLEPTEITDAAWAKTVARLQASQETVAAVLTQDSADISRLQYLFPHDLYHMGQIMYVRALLNKPPIA